MDPSEISPEYELTVRNHIRQTFLPYVRKHITRDHVAYTESKLEQIFTESLDFVPLADPHVLVLPPDPLDTLVRSLKDLDFSFDERLTTDGDTVRKIKSSLKTIVGEGRELRSEACWREEDHMHTHIAEIYRPMTPILTNRARKQTPKAGSNALRASLPRTQPALFEHIGVKSVAVAQIEDSDIPNLEEVLNVRPTIESTTRTYILSLFKSANPPAQLTETNVHVASFLRADSPPLQIQRPLSPPLFSRSQASTGSSWTGITNAKDIVGRLNAAPAPVPEELEDNIDSGNMSIVDGWGTCAVPSSSFLVCGGKADYQMLSCPTNLFSPFRFASLLTRHRKTLLSHVLSGTPKKDPENPSRSTHPTVLTPPNGVAADLKAIPKVPQNHQTLIL
ncbi:hypothetical protein C8R48DRAFT_767834 [Suillus tomentosus]|nr:hypothetical protein C8R48DRAFT_767834 [Suillus tomentosus]